MDDLINLMQDEKNLTFPENVENTKIPISLSYSRLSDFDRNGPKALVERSIETSYAMNYGAIVDSLVLPVVGKSLEDEFIISDLEKPTATSGRLVDAILMNCNEVPTDDQLLELCELSDFWKVYSPEKVLETIRNNRVLDYVDIELNKGDKTIIDSKTYLEARTTADILQSHMYSKDIINSPHESINQFMLSFVYRDILFRGHIDKVIINHEDKTIQVVDLKTGKDSYKRFRSSLLKFRYYMQLAIYTLGMEAVKEDLGYGDYEVLPFKFLYIGRSERIPIVFNTEGILDKAINGFSFNGYRYRGIDEVIDNIIWHFDNNIFDLEMEVIENNGNLPLKLEL